MQRSRFRVITKALGTHAIVDRSTGKTMGLYADGQKAWAQARHLNMNVSAGAGLLDKRLK